MNKCTKCNQIYTMHDPFQHRCRPINNTTVVNNYNCSNDDCSDAFIAGIIIGEALSMDDNSSYDSSDCSSNYDGGCDSSGGDW